VDWGARFEAIRLPARLRVDVRTIDRNVVKKVAEGGQLDVHKARKDARDAIAIYLRNLILTVLLCGGSLGVIVAFAVRGGATPKLRYTTAAAIATAIASATVLITLLPPRGPIDTPQYYAFGPDIPRALEAVETAQRSTKALDQELDAQLVGLARLVTAPANRPSLTDQPRLTIASDLHNNVLALPILERTATGGPVFFVGDLTDRGSPLEAALTRRVVHMGKPFVFVAGNHDSDSLSRDLAADGAVVLTRTGRLNKNGETSGHPIVTAAGLRVAGYDDPFERRAGENYADRFNKTPDATQIERFTTWMRDVRDQVDVVMVHNPALLPDALDELDAEKRAKPLLILVGHTHHAELTRRPGATVINAGTVGAGGTGNLLKQNNDIGIARLSYEDKPAFDPLAVDMVTIDPRSGSATARRERLDEAPGA
jgi:predicted phosphodiesterase